MNAEESSALIRQFVEFCPENTTIKFTMVSVKSTHYVTTTDNNSLLVGSRHATGSVALSTKQRFPGGQGGIGEIKESVETQIIKLYLVI